MGLQNLKSAFSDIIQSSETEGRHVESPTVNTPFLPTSILEATTYAYNSIINEPIEPAGGMEMFESPLLTDLYNNVETTTALNDGQSDVRFQVGFGSFENPNTKLVMSGEGWNASLAYIQSATGDIFVASGAVTKLGKLSEIANSVGIDTPNFDWGAAIDAALPRDPVPLYLKYPMQVEEMFNPGRENLTNDFANTGNPDSTRGIAFQVLGDQNQEGLIPDFRFQDAIKNEKFVEWVSPIRQITEPGNIQTKEDYFKDILGSIGSLGNPLGNPFGDIDLPNINNPFSGMSFGNPFSGLSGIENPFSGISGIGNPFSGIGGINNPFSGLNNPFSGMSFGNPFSGMGSRLGSIRLFSENSKIRGLFSNMGGIFDGVGGFGRNLDLPKFPKLDIDFSKIGNFFSGFGGGFLSGLDFGGFGGGFGGFGSFGGGFSGFGGFGSGGFSFGSFGGGGSGFLNNLSSAASGINSIVQNVQDIAGPLGERLKELKSNLNPIDELKLPQMELQNPRQVSVTEYGGQAIFRSNQPRSLERNVPIRTLTPNEVKDLQSSGTTVTDDRIQTDEIATSTPYSKIGQVIYAGPGTTLGKLSAPSNYYPNQSMDEKAGGDRHTLADVHGDYISGPERELIESTDNGMPFFFKDLRNGSFIIFRGYLAGMGDTISPSWSEQSYIGRSEKTHIYTGTARTINFSFKLAAQTALELDSIYLKVNKLTGLTYPEYMPDNFLPVGAGAKDGQVTPIFKTRMKPPLARLRIGDLFGNPSGETRDGLLGFIESLTYTFPDESPWEFRKGQRVPKFVDVSVGWKVIHERVPSLGYPEFYGYNPDREGARERLQNKTDINASETATSGG